MDGKISLKSHQQNTVNNKIVHPSTIYQINIDPAK